MIRRELIGATMTVIAPNGIPMRLTINEKDVSLYRKLRLDVFHKIETKELKPMVAEMEEEEVDAIHPSEMNWGDLKAYAKANNIEGKSKADILANIDAINEGD